MPETRIKVYDNNITSSGGGILITCENEGVIPWGYISHNFFSNNSQFGIAIAGLAKDLDLPLYNKSAFVEAECSPSGAVNLISINNYWGNSSGPSGLGTGSGDIIYGSIDFQPYLQCIDEEFCEGNKYCSTKDSVHDTKIRKCVENSTDCSEGIPYGNMQTR